MLNRTEFDQQLLHSGMLHWRIDPEYSDSLEYHVLQKEVTERLPLWDNKTLSIWSQSGEGTLCVTPDGTLSCTTRARADHWPEGSPEDGDYCAFGELGVHLNCGRVSWQKYNRLHFFVQPKCPGMHSPLLAIQLYNDGEEKIPDKYSREGYHTIHLKNNQWNECVWEFPALPRDCVTDLEFIIHRYGQELSMEDKLVFELRDISLEYTPKISHTLGWECDKNVISYSTEGYWAEGCKTAVTSTPIKEFFLCDSVTGKSLFSGSPKMVQNEKGTFYVLDFTPFSEEGTYYLKTASFQTAPFGIAKHPLYQSVWKIVHFLYCERCGYPVGRGHGTCHGDILAEHNGVKLAYQGGWHDAGDVSQQTLQTAEVVHSLLEMAQRVQEKEPALYYRLLEEAVWGLDFVLRMRFGDGYRATSAGIRRFSDGLIGNFDDCSARVHNYAFENFMMAGVEAYAAKVLKEMDPPLAEKAYTAACEDFEFARERFEEYGMERYIFFEHCWNSSYSLYQAAASWAASLIFDCQKEEKFGSYAVSYAEEMLKCQETGQTDGCPMSGFFYRDTSCKEIVHFNHQSREQLFMQALEVLCRTQPSHPFLSVWEQAMHLYGNYLKQCFSYSAPYGMQPAGIHKMDEYLDRKTFPLLHLMTTFEEDSPNYLEQLKAGISLNEDYCLRQFPVWFSFRGNTAIHLASGKAASLLGRYFHDDELLQIAREQIYWTFGKNPFCQSLVYGTGNNFAQQYGALNGEMVGSIPVGIETRNNADVPFWPMENNATYKEVWTTSAGRWLWVAADLY